MSLTESPNQLHWSHRLSTLASYMITSVMMACLVTSFVQLGEALLPDWTGSYLVVLGFFVALEAMYAHKIVKFYSFMDPEWLMFRGTEWVVILVLIKLFYYLENGLGKLLKDIPLWLRDFGLGFFTDEYILACLIILIVWVISGLFAAKLSILEAEDKVILQEEESGVYEIRTAVRGHLVNMILFIGVGMVILSAMLRSNAITNWFELPTLRAGVYNVLLYFLLGLVLLSLTQFNIQRVNWIRERLTIRREIASRWVLYSSLFIMMVAIISSLLPTRYSLGFLTVLNYLIYFMARIFTIIATIITLPFFYLISLLDRLFGKPGSINRIGLPKPDVINPGLQAHIPWLELIKSLVFWVVLFIVISYSISYYLRENSELIKIIRRLPLFMGIMCFLNWLRRSFRGVNRQIATAVDEGWKRLLARLSRRAVEQSWRYINLRRLTPRERVMFYYLAMVRRGGEKGLSRKPAQTPYEYSSALTDVLQETIIHSEISDRMNEGTNIPVERSDFEIKHDISALTDRFVEARYSRHSITTQDASLVRRYWDKIRRILRASFRRGKK